MEMEFDRLLARFEQRRFGEEVSAGRATIKSAAQTETLSAIHA